RPAQHSVRRRDRPSQRTSPGQGLSRRRGTWLAMPTADDAIASGGERGRPKVVSLGVHIVDILGRTVEALPEAGGALLIDEIRMTVAGTAAGTAIDLAKLGADVVAIGALGRDELGDFIVATMAGYGIDTSGLVRKRGVQTSASMLPIRANGERTALHVVGANAELALSDIDLPAIADAEFLHLGGTFA